MVLPGIIVPSDQCRTNFAGNYSSQTLTIIRVKFTCHYLRVIIILTYVSLYVSNRSLSYIRQCCQFSAESLVSSLMIDSQLNVKRLEALVDVSPLPGVHTASVPPGW